MRINCKRVIFLHLFILIQLLRFKQLILQNKALWLLYRALNLKMILDLAMNLAEAEAEEVRLELFVVGTVAGIAPDILVHIVVGILAVFAGQ